MAVPTLQLPPLGAGGESSWGFFLLRKNRCKKNWQRSQLHQQEPNNLEHTNLKETSLDNPWRILSKTMCIL